jgi:hypothetical protein
MTQKYGVRNLEKTEIEGKKAAAEAEKKGPKDT